MKYEATQSKHVTRNTEVQKSMTATLLSTEQRIDTEQHEGYCLTWRPPFSPSLPINSYPLLISKQRSSYCYDPPPSLLLSITLSLSLSLSIYDSIICAVSDASLCEHSFGSITLRCRQLHENVFMRTYVCMHLTVDASMFVCVCVCVCV